MIRVGVIGLGMMGMTHLDEYLKRDDVEVIAISDADEDRLQGRAPAAGNIEGQAEGGFDFSAFKKYDEGRKLIRDKNVDLVDVCLPTPMHLEYGRKALRAGKHLMIEKPLARTARDARKLAAVAAETPGTCLVGHCMRFWPGWDWLKQAIDDRRYGALKALHFRRYSTHPGGFYTDGESSGGALLDLHIHDTDFIHHCLGMPLRVSTVGYTKNTGKLDHVVTRYEYEDVPVVVAEGSWTQPDAFAFQMQYHANFERATATYDIGSEHPLVVYEEGKDAGEPVPLRDGMGYTYELAYLIECIKSGRKPTTVTFDEAAETVRIVEAEGKSAANNGRPVKL